MSTTSHHLTAREARLARMRAARAEAPKLETLRIPVSEVRDGDWVLTIHSTGAVRGVTFGDGRRVVTADRQVGRIRRQPSAVYVLRFSTGVTYGPIAPDHDVTVRRPVTQ